MRSNHWTAVGLSAAAIVLSVPAFAFAFGGEVRHEAAAAIPPLPANPEVEPTNLRALVEALTRVDAGGEARFITGLGIARHRVQAIAGLTPAQLAGSALDISIDRGGTNIGNFRAVFGGLLPDADGLFENSNGQNVRFASWEIVRRSISGLGLSVNEGGTGVVNQAVPGHPDIPLVQTGDIATFKVIRNAGTPGEVVTRTHAVAFD
ncbi:MAG: hypothetical protein ACKVWV_06390 [Planctomycetota bacterium]